MDVIDIQFLDKYYFLLIIFVPFIIIYFYKKQKNTNNFKFLGDLKKVFKNNFYIFYIKVILLCFIFIFYVLVIANPNLPNQKQEISKNGIDIVFALDLSYSMNAEDILPNRLESSKSILDDFLSIQETNRVWLVVFAWRPFSTIPLTFDYDILRKNISQLTTKTIDQNVSWLSWTAIWDALLMSSNLFEEDENIIYPREKAIILLTDWDANVWLDPITVSKLLAEKNIKVYSIWIWSSNGWTVTIWDSIFAQSVEIEPLNEQSLINISNLTAWGYYRAENNNAFENAFRDLEFLEKNDIDVSQSIVYMPIYKNFLYLLLAFLLLYIFLIFYRNEID